MVLWRGINLKKRKQAKVACWERSKWLTHHEWFHHGHINANLPQVSFPVVIWWIDLSTLLLSSLTHLVYCFYSFQPSLGHKSDRQRQKNSEKKGDANLFVQLSSAESLEANVIWGKKYEVRELGNGFLLFYGFSLTSDDSSFSCLHIRRKEWLPWQMLLWDVNWGAWGTCWVFPSPQEARLPAVCPITAEVQSQPVLSDTGRDGIIRSSEVLEMKQRFFLSSAIAQSKN